MMEKLKPCPYCEDYEGMACEGKDGNVQMFNFCPICGNPLTTTGRKILANRCAAPENPRRKSGTESAKNGSAPASAGGGNKPLTLERLKQMDGEPVWVKNNAHPEYSEWKICNGAGESHYYFSNGAAYELNHYGKTWLAYARRPEDAP